MESINGLPTHALALHAPVVLLPMLTLACLAVAIRPELRRRGGIALAIATAVVLVATWFAVETGEAFEELAGDGIDASRHESLAGTTFQLVVVLAALVAATVGFDQWRHRGGAPWLDPAAAGLSALSLVVAVAATIWIIRTGDEGARLVWDGIVPQNPSGG